MPRGPAPKPKSERRRTNTDAIPTTLLPVGGRQGPTPKPPSWVHLRTAGKAWWRWAWHTPQAAGWSTNGHLAWVARRAELEDDLAVLDEVEGLDALDALGARTASDFKYLISRLSSLATGRLAIIKVQMELDNRLGLNPKGMVDLRWTIGPDEAPAEGKPTAPSTTRRLRAVDSAAG